MQILDGLGKIILRTPKKPQQAYKCIIICTYITSDILST